MGVSFGNVVTVLRVMAIDVKKYVRRNCSGGALSPALFFFEKLFFEKWQEIKKQIIDMGLYSESLAPSNEVDSSLGVVLILEW